jgi:hypothetical protein
VVLAPGPEEYGSLACTVTVRLKNGIEVSRHVAEFKGTPRNPLIREELKRKFLFLKSRFKNMEMLFDRLQNLENEQELQWIGVPSA